MPNRLKSIGLVLAGVAMSAGLTNLAAQAAENWLKATPSTQTFYVDGRKADLEAYEIGGHNYVKLRDIGKTVGFEVDYDTATNSVIIGGRPVETDYAAQADPAIFTDTLTREVYNGIRDSIVHREEILAGSYTPSPLGSVGSPDNLAGFSAVVGLWPSYQFQRNDDGAVVCLPRYIPAWQTAADHCRPFIDSLSGLSDREKAQQMDFYVCDRMTYALKSAGIGSILSQDGVVPSYCINYAYCFKFLCDMAGIPCILVRSEIHMWNEVYVEGQWWSVDVTGDDGGDDPTIRSQLTILHPPGDFQGAIFRDSTPEVTAFAKELLMPRSYSSNTY